jgi:Domain of unknown function (DUF4397)
VNRLLRWFGAGLLSLTAILSTGCGSSSNGRVRVMNASPDESALDFTVAGKAVGTGVAYGTASNYVSVSSGSQQVQIEAPGSTTPLISPMVSLPSGNSTLIAANFSSSLTAVVLTDDDTAPTSGNIKLRLLNVSPSLGTADVYVVAPGTNLSTVSPTVSSLAFERASSYLSLTAGTYEVFFTLPGSKFPSIDSSPLTFTASQIRTVAAINGQFGGLNTVELADLN